MHSMQKGWWPVRFRDCAFPTAAAPWRRPQACEVNGLSVQAEGGRAMSEKCLLIRTGFVAPGDSAGSFLAGAGYLPAFTITWRCRMDSSHFMFSINSGL